MDPPNLNSFVRVYSFYLGTLPSGTAIRKLRSLTEHALHCGGLPRRLAIQRRKDGKTAKQTLQGL